MKKYIMNFLAQCEVDFESMKRGTYAGFLPLAILAGAAIAKGVSKYKSKKAQGKEAKRAGDEQAQANFESQSAMEGNREDDRLLRTQGIANQLTGARALSPEVLAAALKRRATVARKGAVIDPTKGLGWDLAGDIAGGVGSAAGSYMQGQAMQNAADDGILSQASRINTGGACPPGTQGSNGECYSA